MRKARLDSLCERAGVQTRQGKHNREETGGKQCGIHQEQRIERRRKRHGRAVVEKVEQYAGQGDRRIVRAAPGKPVKENQQGQADEQGDGIGAAETCPRQKRISGIHAAPIHLDLLSVQGLEGVRTLSTLREQPSPGSDERQDDNQGNEPVERSGEGLHPGHPFTPKKMGRSAPAPRAAAPRAGV